MSDWKLEIKHINVGQGDGTVLVVWFKTEIKRILILDSGPSEAAGKKVLDEVKSVIASVNGGGTQKKIDGIVLTHDDLDHIQGFFTLFDNLNFTNLCDETLFYEQGVNRLESSTKSRTGLLANLNKKHQFIKSFASDGVQRASKDTSRNVKNPDDEYLNFFSLGKEFLWNWASFALPGMYVEDGGGNFSQIHNMLKDKKISITEKRGGKDNTDYFRTKMAAFDTVRLNTIGTCIKTFLDNLGSLQDRGEKKPPTPLNQLVTVLNSISLSKLKDILDENYSLNEVNFGLLKKLIEALRKELFIKPGQPKKADAVNDSKKNIFDALAEIFKVQDPKLIKEAIIDLSTKIKTSIAKKPALLCIAVNEKYLSTLIVNDGDTAQNHRSIGCILLSSDDQIVHYIAGDLTDLEEIEIANWLEKEGYDGNKRTPFMKFSHHGAKGSTPSKLLKMLKPRNAIISASSGKHPHPSIELLYYIKFFNEIFFNDQPIKVYATNFPRCLSYLNYKNSTNSFPLEIKLPKTEKLWGVNTIEHKNKLMDHINDDLKDALARSGYQGKNLQDEMKKLFLDLTEDTKLKEKFKDLSNKTYQDISDKVLYVNNYCHNISHSVLDKAIEGITIKKRKLEEALLNTESVESTKKKLKAEEPFKDLMEKINDQKLFALDKTLKPLEIAIRVKTYQANLEKYISNLYHDCKRVWVRLDGFPNDENYYLKEEEANSYQGAGGYPLYTFWTTSECDEVKNFEGAKKILLSKSSLNDENEIKERLPLLLRYKNKSNQKDAICVIGYDKYQDGANLTCQSSPDLSKKALDNSVNPPYFYDTKHVMTVSSYHVEPLLYHAIQECIVFPTTTYKQILNISLTYDESKTKLEEMVKVSPIDVVGMQMKMINKEFTSSFGEEVVTEDYEEEEENQQVQFLATTSPNPGDRILLGLIGNQKARYQLNLGSGLAAFIGLTTRRAIELEVVSFHQDQQTIRFSATLGGFFRKWLSLTQVFLTQLDIVAIAQTPTVWSVQECIVTSNWHVKGWLKDLEWLNLNGTFLADGRLALAVNSTQTIRNNFLSNAQYLKCFEAQSPLALGLKQFLDDTLELPLNLEKTKVILNPSLCRQLQTRLVSDFNTVTFSNQLSLKAGSLRFSRDVFFMGTSSPTAYSSVGFDAVVKIGRFDFEVTATLDEKGAGTFLLILDERLTVVEILKAVFPGSETTLEVIERFITIHLMKSIYVRFDLAKKEILSIKLNASITLEGLTFDGGIDLPEVSVWAELAKSNTISLNDIVGKFWPEARTALPKISVNELAASVYPISREVVFHSSVNSGEFKIANVPFLMQGAALNISKTPQKISGSIAVDLMIQQTSLTMSAEFGEKITFNGQLSNVKLSALLKDFAGAELPNELPDVEFSHLGFSMTPKDKKFSVIGDADFIWTINEKKWKCSSALTLIKEEDKNFSVTVSVSSLSPLSLIDEFVFKSGSIDFILEKNNGNYLWTASGSLATSVFTHDCSMKVKYEQAQKKLQLDGTLGSVEKTLIDFGSAKICGTKCNLDIQKSGDQITGWFAITGSLDIPGVTQTSGSLKFYYEPKKQGLRLEMKEVRIPIVQASSGVTPKDIAFLFKEPKLEVEKRSGSSGEWIIDTSVKMMLEGLPAYLTELKLEGVNTKFIPDAVDLKFKLSKSEFELIATVNTRIDIQLPNIRLGQVDIPLRNLGRSRLELQNIHAKIGRRSSVTARVGFALPSRLNHVLFGETDKNPAFKLFKVFNETDKTGTCDFEVGLGYIGSSQTPQILVKLLENSLPFENFVTVQAEKWKVDLGEFGAILIDPLVFSSTGKDFTASFGYEIDPTKPLKISLTPLKELLKRSNLTNAANLLPASLPLLEFELYDRQAGKLKMKALEDFLTAIARGTGVDLREILSLIGQIEEKANKLPKDFLDYLNFKLPQQLKMSLSFTADAGLNMEVKLGATDELKMLFPTLAPLPMLHGIKLKGFSFGTLLGGSLLSLKMNMIFDQFDLLTTVLGLTLPYDEAHPENNVIPPLSSVQKRLIVENLWMLIIYYTGLPIPVPVFYDRLAIEYLGIEGIQAQANASLVMKGFDLISLARMAKALKEFAIDRNYRLSSEQNIHNLEGTDVQFKLYKIFVKTPKYLGGQTLGTEDDIPGVRAIRTTAAVLDAFKFLDLKELVKLIPDNYRFGQYNLRFGPFDLQGEWWITTLQEFRQTQNRRIDIDPTQLQNYLPEKNPYFKDDSRMQKIDWKTTSKDGALFWMKSRVAFDQIGHLESVFGLVCIDGQGFFTGVRLDGKIGSLELKMGGALSIQKNESNQLQLVIHAQTFLMCAKRSLFESQLLVLIEREKLWLHGTFNLFRDVPLLQLSGAMIAAIEKQGVKFDGTFGCNLGLLNLAQVSVHLSALTGQPQAFWIKGTLFGQDIFLDVFVQEGTVSLSMRTGQFISGALIKTADRFATQLLIQLQPLCALSFRSDTALTQISGTVQAELKLLDGLITAGGQLTAQPGLFEYKNGHATLLPAGLPVNASISNLNGTLSGQQFKFSGTFDSSLEVGVGLCLRISTNGSGDIHNYGAAATINSTLTLSLWFPFVGLTQVRDLSSFRVGFKVTQLTNNRPCFIAVWNLGIWPLPGDKNRLVVYLDSKGGVELEVCQTSLDPLPEYQVMSESSNLLLDGLESVMLYPGDNETLQLEMPADLPLADDILPLSVQDFIIHALHEEHDLDTKLQDKTFLARILKSAYFYGVEFRPAQHKLMLKHNAHTATFFTHLLHALLAQMEDGAGKNFFHTHFSKMTLEFSLKDRKPFLRIFSEEYPACWFNTEAEFDFFNGIHLTIAGRTINAGRNEYFDPILEPFRIGSPQTPNHLLTLAAVDPEDPNRGYWMITHAGHLSIHSVRLRHSNTLTLTQSRSEAAILIPVFEKDAVYFCRSESQGGGVLTLNTNGYYFNFYPLQAQDAGSIRQRFAYHFANTFVKMFGAKWERQWIVEQERHQKQLPLSLKEYAALYMFSNHDFKESSVLNLRVKKTEELLNISNPKSYHYGRFLIKYNLANKSIFEREKDPAKGIPRLADVQYVKGSLSVLFTEWDLDPHHTSRKFPYEFECSEYLCSLIGENGNDVKHLQTLS